MDKDEIKKRISELEPLAQEAWNQFQAYENSNEYKAAHEKCKSLNEAWYKLHTKLSALKTLLDDNQS